MDGQGVEDRLPAVDVADEVGTVGSVLVGDEVEHFQCGLLVGEVPSMPDRSPESGVERLDGVGRVDDLAEFGWELEERCELFQVFSHELIIAGYWVRQRSANSANNISAAGKLGAV